MRCSGNPSYIRRLLREDPEKAKAQICRSIDRHEGNTARVFRDFFLCPRAGAYLIQVSGLLSYARAVREVRRARRRQVPRWVQETRAVLRA